MEVSGLVIRQLFEAAEAAGIPRSRLVVGLDPDARLLSSLRHRVRWDTAAAIMNRLSELLDGDIERLRNVGAKMVGVPSYAFLRVVARSLASPQALYDLGGRWVAPAGFPHMPLVMEHLPGSRMRARGWIPAPHAPCMPFMYIFEGVSRELPCVLGLPPATIESSHVTPRSVLTMFVLPRSPSLLRRAAGSVAAVLGGRRQAAELMDEQQRELEEGLAALRDSSVELQRVLDGLPDPVAIHHEGTVLWVNHALALALGYESADELIGTRLLDVVHASSRPAVEEWVRAGGADRASGELTQALLCRRDGGTFAVEMSVSKPVTFAGRAARLLAARDVTERSRLQQRLMTTDRLTSLAMLAAGVAHEVNNPLAYARGSIEIARRELSRLERPPEEAQQALGTALEGIDRIREIVRDLRILSSADEATMQPVDVREVLDATLKLAASHIAPRAMVVRDYHDVPPAHANAARLGQVFLNLIINALDAMDAGEPGLHHLRLRVAMEDEKIVAAISDTGVGISPELLGRVFDPFFTTKLDGTGTGLGLAICHQLVGDLGGKITVESSPGRGTTFRIALQPTGSVRPAPG